MAVIHLDFDEYCIWPVRKWEASGSTVPTGMAEASLLVQIRRDNADMAACECCIGKFL